jgi:hypothetical protein
LPLQVSGVTVLGHFEAFLGEIELGWSRDADGHDMPFQVVRFPRGSGDGTITFATLGLSRYPQRSASGKTIRQELLMIVPESLRTGPVPGLLQQAGMETLTAARPLLRGDVIGPRGKLVSGSRMEALYVSLPVYFPDDFAVYQGEEPIMIAWLVPISAREAEYLSTRGWRAFEDRLTESDPDLTDIYRSTLPV